MPTKEDGRKVGISTLAYGKSPAEEWEKVSFRVINHTQSHLSYIPYKSDESFVYTVPC